MGFAASIIAHIGTHFQQNHTIFGKKSDKRKSCAKHAKCSDAVQKFRVTEKFCRVPLSKKKRNARARDTPQRSWYA